jgi:signal transduction histidine kinase
MKFKEFKENLQSKGEVSIRTESDARIKNLEVILDIVKSINRSLILNDVLQLVLNNAIKLTQSERGFIVLIDQAGILEYKLGLDSEDNNLPEESFNVSTTVVEDVFQTGQSKFIEGAQSDTNYDSSKSILKLELQTILCSALIADDKKIGVIYVDSKHLHKIKIREITDTFEILAGQAATAIRNAQLYRGQINAYNALNEANMHLIQVERKALKASIDSETGQSLQGLVHFALLELESLLRTIEKSRKDFEGKFSAAESILFDRLKVKSKVAMDSIRNIQKYAQVLIETSIMNLKKDDGDINRTIQSVIKYLSAIKKFTRINFKIDFSLVPPCRYDDEQIQHLLVHLFSNSAEFKPDATILIKTYSSNEKIYVEVRDDGPGIPVAIKEKVFEPPTIDKPGYGLFLCRNIIDQHNGEIRILDSARGTVIQISLPSK